ncbi:MAG: hypothetical protein AAB131_14700 [Actinomycetota bacterium]|jgi:hypothetical protein|nr:MAG: hypothetical protein FD127_3151 [Acidimicrobiaceae bacterium]
MSDWWRAVEDELERLSDEAPDPWGAVDVSAVDAQLTAEQRAFLAQMVDSPDLQLEAADLEAGDLEAGDDPPAP